MAPDHKPGVVFCRGQKRIKEIGVRKVLGASVAGLVKKINGEFVGLVFLANVISWPVAYYCVKIYLQNYAYRVRIVLWPFLAALSLSFLLAVLTVSLQAFKAARQNPAYVLRYE
jgi:ABC-type antimicrobial peptide transport system permease subunit